METLALCLLAAICLLSVSLQRTYARYSLKELKKRSRQGDEIAEALVNAVGYEYSLRALLWLLIGITAAGFFVLVSRQAPLWVALSSSTLLIWVGFVWIPVAKVSSVSQKVAAWLSPVFGRLLSWIDPVIGHSVRLIRKYRPLHVHTGLYDKEDLLELIETQRKQPENQIGNFELDIVTRALLMGDVLVRDRMIPRRKIRMVSIHDNLGPIILDELHASGFSRFPVYDGKQDNVISTLYLKDLVKVHKSASVRALMRNDVYYLHEDQTMHDALQAVLKTHHHLFMVVNEFEEITGIISSEDVFESIVGQAIRDEFDQYDNIRAVTAKEARQAHDQRTAEASEPVPSEMEESEELDAEALLAESSAHEASDDDIETIELDK